MTQPRSRRLRLLESLRRTINEMLHDRVQRAADAKGRCLPVNTSMIYTSASREAPELLNQLLLVHQRVAEEQGRAAAPTPPDQLDDPARRAMLSAVRAAVNRTQAAIEP